MCRIGPLAHISADLGQNSLRKGIAEAMYGDQIHARHAQDMGACVDRRRVLTV
jgi:hypothetical protein